MKRKISLLIILVLCFSMIMVVFANGQSVTTNIASGTVSLTEQTFHFVKNEDSSYYTVKTKLGQDEYANYSISTMNTEHYTIPEVLYLDGLEVKYITLSTLKSYNVIVPNSISVVDDSGVYSLEDANNLFDLKGILSEDGSSYKFTNYKITVNNIVVDSIIIKQTATTDYIYKQHTVYQSDDGTYFIFDESTFISTDVSLYRIFFINKNLPGFIIDILEPPYTWIINLF